MKETSISAKDNIPTPTKKDTDLLQDLRAAQPFSLSSGKLEVDRHQNFHGNLLSKFRIH